MNFLICFFILLASFCGWSKALLISDVDDTLKVVRTGNPLDTIGNAFNEYWAYPGMSEKYVEITIQIQDIKIIYLTNASKRYLSRTHLNFLRNNHFPDGRYIPRPDDISTEKFKFNQINKLIELENPDQLILIGDNIERDPIIYDLVAQLYEPKGIRVQTYIHNLPFGSTPLKQKQIAYKNASEIQPEK